MRYEWPKLLSRRASFDDALRAAKSSRVLAANQTVATAASDHSGHRRGHAVVDVGAVPREHRGRFAIAVPAYERLSRAQEQRLFREDGLGLYISSAV